MECIKLETSNCISLKDLLYSFPFLMPIMSKEILETKMKLKELRNTANKDLKRIVNDIDRLEFADFIQSIVVLDKITNKELTKIFDNIRDLYEKDYVDGRVALNILNYKFLRGSKDIEIAILSYFKLLDVIRTKIPRNDFFNSEMFNKCYTVINNRVTSSHILKEIYLFLRNIMLDDTLYLNIFVNQKCYRNFRFFNNFINDFYKHLNDEQSVELFEYIDEHYQIELFIKLRNFNPYLMLIKSGTRINIETPLLYLVFDSNFIYDDVASNYAKTDKSGFIKSLYSFFTEKNGGIDANECYFHDIHGKIEDRFRLKRDLLSSLSTFDDIAVFDKLRETFQNPFFFIRFSKKTNLSKLGDFIGKEKNSEYLRMFMETFDFEEMSLISALREFLSTFILPGESQMIIRLLESFSHKFYKDKKLSDNDALSLESKERDEINSMLENIDIDEPKQPVEREFLSVNIQGDEPVTANDNLKHTNEPNPNNYTERDIYVITYSLLMLNTNIYSTIMKTKMNRKLFIENIRKCKISEEFTNSYLESIYYEIKNRSFEYVGSNKYNFTNYKLLSKLEETLKDDKLKEVIGWSRFNDPLINIENKVCNACKASTYNILFELHNDSFLESIFEDNSDLNTHEMLDMFVKICCLFNSSLTNIKLFYLFYQNFDDSLFDSFFELFFQIIESSSSQDLGEIKRDVGKGKLANFFELPFLTIRKKLENEKIDKLFMFKKERKIDPDSIKTINKFIRNASSMSNENFVSIVSQNLKHEVDYLIETLYQIIYKNCFRISLIIDVNLIIFLSHKKSYIKEVIDKIIDLGQKEDFYNFLELYDSYNLGSDDIVFNITKEHPTIISESIFTIYRKPFKSDSEKSFAILLQICRNIPVFDIVCGDFVNNYISLTNSEEFVDIEEIRNKKLELFVNHLTVPQKLISFYMSSSECINYAIIARYTCKKKTTPCPLENMDFVNIVNKQITYLILKDHLLDDYDLHQYTFYTIQILGRSVPSLIEYFLNNIFIFRYIEGVTLRSIIKIILNCIKRQNQASNNCACGNEHDIKDKIKRLTEFLEDNKYLTNKQSAFIEEMKKYDKTEDNKTEDNENKTGGNEDKTGGNVFEL